MGNSTKNYEHGVADDVQASWVVRSSAAMISCDKVVLVFLPEWKDVNFFPVSR